MICRTMVTNIPAKIAPHEARVRRDVNRGCRAFNNNFLFHNPIFKEILLNPLIQRTPCAGTSLGVFALKALVYRGSRAAEPAPLGRK
jgi:hypothetical protein